MNMKSYVGASMAVLVDTLGAFSYVQTKALSWIAHVSDLIDALAPHHAVYSEARCQHEPSLSRPHENRPKNISDSEEPQQKGRRIEETTSELTKAQKSH